MEESTVPVNKSVHYAIVLHKNEEEEETLVETDVKEEVSDRDLIEETKENVDKNMENKKETETSMKIKEEKKKNSIDLDYLDDEIFNITINMASTKNVQKNKEENKKEREEDDEEEEGQRLSDLSSGEEKEEERNKRSRRRSIGKEYQENKKRKRNNEYKKENSSENGSRSSDESSGSANEVCKILKVHINDKPERKNRASYILQHKQRTKEKNKEKSKKNQKKNEPRASFLKLNNNTRENNRRTSVATNMLDKLSNLGSDPEDNEFGSNESELDLDVFGNSD